MRREQKIGFALGLLLVGIVAALFFRDEAPVPEPQELASLEEINARIDERANAPYPLPPGLGGSAERPEIMPPRDGEAEPLSWQVPEFLKEPVSPPPTRDVLPPDPIPLHEVSQRDDFPPVRPREPADAAAAAPTPPAACDDAEDLPLYTVKKGDTLSGIAEAELGSAARFLEVFELNRDQLRSPDDLRIGQKIRIPGKHSQPSVNNDAERTVPEPRVPEASAQTKPERYRRREKPPEQSPPEVERNGDDRAPVADGTRGPLPLFIPYRGR